MWELFNTMHLHPLTLQTVVLLSENNLRSIKTSLWDTPQGLRVLHSVDTVINLLWAIPLAVAWELVRLHLHNRRQPPYSGPSKPVSGDGKPHSTNFSDRSIILQTAVTESPVLNRTWYHVRCRLHLNETQGDVQVNIKFVCIITPQTLNTLVWRSTSV